MHADAFKPLPAPPDEPGHMSTDEFRSAARELVDFICDYYDGLEARPVLARTTPGDVFRALPDAPPPFPEPFSRTLDDTREHLLPNLTHWQHPSFFAYFPANASFPAILGDMLSAALGVQGMLWQTSPACTEVETRVLDWLALALGLPAAFTSGGAHPDLAEEPELRDLIGTPDEPTRSASPTRSHDEPPRPNAGGGVILSTASEAVLTALVASLDRHRRSAESVQQPIVYTSTQAHSSVLKAVSLAGLDRDHVRLIPTDGSLAMDAGALARAMKDDAEHANRPTFVCATLGTTSSGAFDPLERIGPLCREHRAWLHVDAAWAGSAYLCPELRRSLRGVHLADTFSFNPHKWMLTNFDCSALFLNGAERRDDLLRAMSITPEYLRNAASDAGSVIDYRDWHIPLGRRFRALKLWFVLRHYGVKGLQDHVRTHVRQAAALERVIEQDERFELAAPRSLSLLCIRAAGDDDAGARTRAILDAVNAGGSAYLTHTSLPPTRPDGPARFVIRIAIGGTLTRDEHVRKLWQTLVQTAESLDPIVKNA